MEYLKFEFCWNGWDEASAKKKKTGTAKGPRKNVLWRSMFQVIFMKDEKNTFRKVLGVKTVKGFATNEFLTFAAGQNVLSSNKPLTHFFEDSTITNKTDFGDTRTEYLLRVRCGWSNISFLTSLTCSNEISKEKSCTCRLKYMEGGEM